MVGFFLVDGTYEVGVAVAVDGVQALCGGRAVFEDALEVWEAVMCYGVFYGFDGMLVLWGVRFLGDGFWGWRQGFFVAIL